MTISNSTLLGTQCDTSRDLNLTLKKFLFLAGIVFFLIVEKLVRYVEDFSGGINERDDNDADENLQELSQEKDGILSEKAADSPNGDKPNGGAILRKFSPVVRKL
ncbi:hypothetical protein KY284_019382 [Solanum tuberosum]|nr:hypothetical protein KY284_019382 [Solanum tuberosum]